MFCSNCGQELAPESKFCSNCGAPVQSGASGASSSGSSRDSDRDWGGYSTSDEAPTPQDAHEDAVQPERAPTEVPYTGDGFAERKPTWELERERLRDSATDEWSMPNLGPAKPQRRRTWLWVLLGMIALTVIACCVFFFWILGTESGTAWFEGIATQAAEEMVRATENAATPVP